MQTREKARAKLNISLDILGKLPDGYHEMRMILQTVALYDDVQLRVRPGEGIRVFTNLRYLPSDGRNIAAKAAELFYRSLGISGFFTEIRLQKRIPVCAGLAGGSSDAAAVLRALDRLHKTNLRREALEKLGEQLGSDVPFCIAGGTVEATGRGELLQPLPPLPHCPVVICKPAFSISTPELFSRVDCKRIRIHPQTSALIERLEAKDLLGVAQRMYNVFEDVLPPRCGEVAGIKGRLLEYGALGTSMSGTGSAVFGLFDSAEKAKLAYDSLKKDYRDCFLTETIGRRE